MKPLDNILVLLVDDDANFQKVLAFNLSALGAEVITASNGREGLERFAENSFDLVLTDVKMPEMDGLAFLKNIRGLNSEIPVIMITAHGDVEIAVEAMIAGANDFITKPFEREALQERIARALRIKRLEQENRALREQLTDRYSFENIIGSSPAMRQLFDLMGRVAQRDTTVLIVGESGVGKELVAKALHHTGPRAPKPFVPVNCAAIAPTLLESELFGHVKGAFTGADSAREGRFQAASGGTLFLDEIGDMPVELQSKMLRVLQERSVEPVGSDKSYPTDVRIIAGTNQNLERRVQEKEFREDLYYRLNVVQLHVPPLRDRLEDVPLLVKHFLDRFGEPKLKVQADAMQKLALHHWPGNVRELENAIERSLALRKQEDCITVDDITLSSLPGLDSQEAMLQMPEEGLSLDEVEKTLIERSLRRTGNNQTRAAKILGVTRQQLIYRIQKHGIQ